MTLTERQLTTRTLLKEAVYLLHAHPELNTLPNTPHITIDQDTTATITITGTTSLTITAEGRALLAHAMPIWTKTHAVIEARLPQETSAEALRAELRALA